MLVNNAGVMPLSPLEELRVDEWDRMIDVNVRGVLHGIAAALPAMRQQGSGQFVNVASVGAYEVVPTAAVYSATKSPYALSPRDCARNRPATSESPPFPQASPNPNSPIPSRTRVPART